MQSKNVREIREAINLQAMRGTRRVNTSNYQGRVIDAKMVKGQLKVKLIGSGTWMNADFVNID
jgi:hypothetical protein